MPGTLIQRIKSFSLVIFDTVNDLRLHVLLNYFLVVSWFLHSSGVDVQHSVEYALVAGCAAGFAYLLNRYTDYPYDLIVDKGLTKAPRIVYLLLSSLFLLAALLFSFKDVVYITPLFLGLVLGVFYSVKTFFKYPLKNYFLVKNIFASMSKYIVTFCGVIIFYQVSIILLIKSLSMLAFHFIYELLWDIRDVKSDLAGKVSTVPLRFGKNITMGICFFVWLIVLLVQFPFVNHTDYFFLKYVIVLFFILSLLKVSNVRWFHVMTYVHLILTLTFINKEVVVYIKTLLY